jgi:hypothetical protein
MRTLAIFDAPVWRGRPLRQAQGKLRPRNASSKIAPAGNFWRFCALFVLLIAALTSCSVAQKAPAASRTGRRTATRSRNRLTSASRRSSSYTSPYTSLPFPFFGDSFDPSDIYSTGYPVASEPPPFLMEAMRQFTGSASNPLAQAMSQPATRQASSSDPVLIELQNGRYVRVEGTAANGDALLLQLAPNHSQASSAHQPTTAASSPAQNLPSAVLIFRDGHSEEVRDYTIADGILYARGDYYTDGYWSKKIDLAALNVPETLQANANRSVKFVLPSSPNEVITRP